MAKETSTAQIGFEQYIWDAACLLIALRDTLLPKLMAGEIIV